jgi:hypothetical protein
MSPFPVNPRWYKEYWMTEQPPRSARLAAGLRRLVCVWHKAAHPGYSLFGRH